MGIDLGDLFTHEVRRLEDFKGRVVAIDAYNSLYQFLSIIRQPDGTPLMDRRGRVTSHLSGLLYRTANMVQKGILPAYVYDGEPHPLKMGVIIGRSEHRARAEVEWREALEEGNLERARMKAQQAAHLSEDMVRNSRELLELMGVPWIQAPKDGEAQASYMATKGDAWATGSQDYDSLLYGSPRLVKNLAISGRRKLPRRQQYVDVNIELIELQSNLNRLGITREQLVDMAILMGTDFNEGIRGIGPRKALDLILKHGDLEAVMEHEDLLIENWQEVREIFLDPDVTDDYQLEWREPDEERILEFLCEGYDFSRDRVATALRKIREGLAARDQRSLDQWF